MRDHPYRDLPDTAYWRRAVVQAGPLADPVAGPFPHLTPQDRVATAGSCFAQHIARHLTASGYNHFIAESAHPILPPDVATAHGYGLFSTRTGNIYTSLQLLQLIDRAYGRFTPVEDAWMTVEGRVLDPYRPTIEPGGFASLAEMQADRVHHLACVRRMFETLDIFVFTLGLTEVWTAAVDGAAFPICPGVAGGRFDPAAHIFRNLRVADVTGHLAAFVDRLRSVNPGARIMFTVSPVPLAATAAPAMHVLSATTYSKAVLRAAAQEIAEDRPDIHYFPSYEIVTGPQARGRFFADDLRQVTEDGIAHVMTTFLTHATSGAPLTAIGSVPPPAGGFADDMARWVQVMCDEAMLDP